MLINNYTNVTCTFQGTEADRPEGDDHINETDIEEDSTQHPPQSENTEGKSTPAVSRQKTSSRKRISEVASAIKELKELNKTFNSTKQVDDECETFGKYVAVQLQKLHPEQCIMAQEEIQRVLTKYRLAALSYNNSGPSAPLASVSPAHSSYSSNMDDMARSCSVSPVHFSYSNNVGAIASCRSVSPALSLSESHSFLTPPPNLNATTTQSDSMTLSTAMSPLTECNINPLQ